MNQGFQGHHRLSCSDSNRKFGIESNVPTLPKGLLSCHKLLPTPPPPHPPLWFHLPKTKYSSVIRFASSRTKASGPTSRKWTRRVSSSTRLSSNSFSWV